MILFVACFIAPVFVHSVPSPQRTPELCVVGVQTEREYTEKPEQHQLTMEHEKLQVSSIALSYSLCTGGSVFLTDVYDTLLAG